MTDDSVRDRGALWHFREASKYASAASFTSGHSRFEDNRLINAELQAHYREMGQLHATLFVGLTQVLNSGAHNSGRAALASIAEGLHDDGKRQELPLVIELGDNPPETVRIRNEEVLDGRGVLIVPPGVDILHIPERIESPPEPSSPPEG